MKLEHLALNVKDPAAFSKWYVDHLGMSITFKMEEFPHTHFIADEGETMMIEIYNNPPEAVPEYASMDPLLLHIAFASENPNADKERLVAAGASFVSEVHLDAGTHLVMLRDPFGLALQLCKRGKPMLAMQKKG